MDTTGSSTPTTAETEQVQRARLLEDLRTVFVDVEELLKATASQTGERLTAVRAKAEESLNIAKASLTELQALVTAQTKVAAKATDDYARANPWQAVGISTAVGLILGILIARR